MTGSAPRARALDTPAAPSRAGTGRPEIRTVRLGGRVPYREALELQRRLARQRIDGRRRHDLLLLLEHEPVLTLGRSTDRANLRADADSLSERGVELVEIERGGDVTYHGPGQLVGYPILDLRDYRKDLHWYLRAVESALVGAVGELGLPAFRVPEHTGVWVGERPDDGEGLPAALLEGRIRKIASIGVHVSRWVTWHGFALNITDRALENFGLIVPCGIRGVRMTSLEGEGIEAGADGALSSPVRDAVAAGFAAAFGARVTGGREPELGTAATGGAG